MEKMGNKKIILQLVILFSLVIVFVPSIVEAEDSSACAIQCQQNRPNNEGGVCCAGASGCNGDNIVEKIYPGTGKHGDCIYVSHDSGAYGYCGTGVCCCWEYYGYSSECTERYCQTTASGNWSCYYTQCDGSGYCSRDFNTEWCCDDYNRSFGCSDATGLCETTGATCVKGYCNAECAVNSDCPSGIECDIDTCLCGTTPPPTECDGTCNGVCHSSCTGVDEDPDCGCKNNDGCCGIGCTSANDSDCFGGCSDYTSSSQCTGADCCWCSYPAPVHCQNCPCEELPPPAGEGQAVCTGYVCPNGLVCKIFQECVINCGNYGCFNYCPGGECCCKYNDWPWCCNDVGYANPSNCDCGAAPYCCPKSAPILCAGNCYAPGTECACNGSATCPSCCFDDTHRLKSVTSITSGCAYFCNKDNTQPCGCPAPCGTSGYYDCVEYCAWGCENGVCKSPPPCYGWSDGTQPTACSGNNYCCGGECVSKPASCAECQYKGLCCSGTSAVCCNEPTTTICGTKDCDYLDTTCRDYHDVTKYCDGSGACPPASCDSWTNAAASVECGIKTIPCPEGEASCTQYCDGNGSCIDCEPTCNQTPIADSLSYEMGCIWPLVTLKFTYNDDDGITADPMSAYEVQIDDNDIEADGCLLSVTDMGRLEQVSGTENWLNGWTHRIEAEIVEHSGLDLFNYQILITLNSTNFDFSSAQANGKDFRITSGDGITLFDYWIESWDSVLESAKVWVNVPLIPGSASKTIYMYYRNPSASSASDRMSVFPDIIEPSFETVDYWNLTVNQTGGGGTLSGSQSTGWKTNRAYSYYFSYAFYYPACPIGNFVQINQSINFTNIDRIDFDTKMDGYASSQKFQIYVNETKVWEKDTMERSEFLGEQIDVSDFSGVNELKIRLYVYSSALNGGYAYIDNLIPRKYASPEPSIIIEEQTQVIGNCVLPIGENLPVKTNYYWRVKVQDSNSAWSDYTTGYFNLNPM